MSSFKRFVNKDESKINVLFPFRRNSCAVFRVYKLYSSHDFCYSAIFKTDTR